MVDGSLACSAAVAAGRAKMERCCCGVLFLEGNVRGHNRGVCVRGRVVGRVRVRGVCVCGRERER